LTRVVADSNIYIISAMRFGGRPEEFLRAAEDGRFVLLVSEPILREVAEVFVRKFGWHEARVFGALQRIRAIAELTVPEVLISACVDPDDDRILEAAVAGRATHIVSGDKDLLRMNGFQDVEIVTVNDFLSRRLAPPPEAK
jgi:uncharacterized protein